MSETDPGYSDQHAGDVGAHRATVGTPTERESINVPPTRPGAAENARKAQLAREEHETFIPETPVPDDRTEAVESRAVEEESLTGGRRRHHDEEDEDDDVRRSIKETRNELGDTVGALAHKADLKGRAAEAAGKVREATPDQVKDAATEARKRPVLLLAAVGAVIALVVRRLRKRSRAK